MQNVRLRKDGYYEYRKCINGKYISLYAKTKTYLKAKIKENKVVELKLRLESQVKQPKQNKDLNFEYEIIKWYENYKKPNISIKTQESYNTSIFKHLIPCFKNKNINEITSLEIQTLINKLGATRTGELVYIHLNAFFTFCFAENKILKNPMNTVIKAKRKKSKAQPLMFNEQIKFFAEIQNHKFKHLLYFYLFTGVRRNEALSLKWQDINFESKIIKINGTKTDNAERYIKVSDSLLNLLLELKNNNNNYDNVFNYKDEDKISKEITKLLKQIGSQGSTHKLRHTALTNLYYLEMNPKQIQELAGHSSITITQDIYTHLVSDITKEKLKELYKDLYYIY